MKLKSLYTAIIALPDLPPVIVQAESEALLCGDILALAHTPADIETINDIRAWLASLPRPSGVYDTLADAKASARAVIERRRNMQVEPSVIADIRHSLALSRVDFGKALGFNGNANTVNKTIYEIEQGKMTLNLDKTEKLLAMKAQLDLDGCSKREAAI